MPNLEEINEWMDANCITKKKLAEMMGFHAVHVSRVLGGKSKMSKHFEHQISRLMSNENNYFVATVPPEAQLQIELWAAEAHCSIDRMVDQLLASLLGVPLGDSEQEGSSPQSD